MTEDEQLVLDDASAELALRRVRELFRPNLSLLDVLYRVESSKAGRMDLIRRLRRAAKGMTGGLNWREMMLDRAIEQASAGDSKNV